MSSVILDKYLEKFWKKLGWHCHTFPLQSVGYSPYHRSAGQIEHTLTGSAKAGYIIKKTQAVEEHVVTPFSRSDGQVTGRAR